MSLLAFALPSPRSECKLTLDDGHADWVSAVRFSPSPENPIFVSASWDKTVKVWSLTNFKLKADLVGHTGYISAVTVSPDGSLCASGGKDGVAMLWDLNEGKRLYSLEAGTIIHSLCFSPNRYWLCAATSKNITIWDLESKAVVAELAPEWEVRRELRGLIVAALWLAPPVPRALCRSARARRSPPSAPASRGPPTAPRSTRATRTEPCASGPLATHKACACWRK